MTDQETDIAIIGGGLCGLAVADGLARQQRDFRLFEARDRIGGRILSLPGPVSGSFDLGPAWIWPHNTRMLALARRFGLDVHRQHATGNLVFEDGQGTVRRDLTFATMGDALRVSKGLATLTKALEDAVGAERLCLSHAVTSIDATGPRIRVDGTSPQGRFTVTARRIVLALPPRLAAETLAFERDPGQGLRAAMTGIPTWMAGQAKLVAVYDRQFWRYRGLSGDAISHIGPLMEIHDACDEATMTPALFGFVRPGLARGGVRGLNASARAQLARLFGPEAASPLALLVKDWATDPRTSTPRDAAAPAQHPAYGLPRAVSDWAGDRMILAGTETAPRDGGFLEGALEAAETVLDRLR